MSTLNIYNSSKIIIFSLILFISTTQMSYGASLNLAWDANAEGDLTGYKVYYGTSSGNYGTPIDVGNVTQYELSGLTEGDTYYIAITAYDTSDNESEKSIEVSGVAPSTTSTIISSTTTTTPLTTTTTSPSTTTTTSPSTTTTASPSTTTTATVNSIIEAEEMGYHTNGRQEGEYWNLWGNGTMSENIYFPSTGSYRFEITAKGRLAYDIGPEMELLIDGEIKGKVFVNTTTPETFAFNVEIHEGSHEFAIGFYNDYYDSSAGIDRNLYVDNTTIKFGEGKASTTTTTPATTTIISPAPGPGPTPATTTSVTTTTTPSPTSTTTTVVSTTTTIPTDKTLLTGTITINNGDNTTHSSNVTLTLFATDSSEELSGNGMMKFSNDSKEWSDPEPYTTTKTWALSPGEGEKTVFVKFRDPTGNWMTNPAKDQIRFEESEDPCDDPPKIKPVSLTASSEFLPFWAKDMVVDSNPLTFWSTLPTLFWQNEFITLDLGEIKQVSRVEMYVSKLFSIDFFPVNFQIQISKDNIDWEEIYTEKNYNLRSTDSANWDLNSQEARYLRVYITKAKTFFIFYLAQIAEIEVYGCDLPEENLSLYDKSLIDDKNPSDYDQAGTDKTPGANRMTPTVPGKPVITFN